MQRLSLGMKLLIPILVVMLSIGCAPARKPETPPAPRTIVVPEVSKINFETIDYEKAPDIVKALAKNLEGKHFGTWTAVNGRNYVVVSQSNLPVGNKVVISEIERRVPANDFDWVNVRLSYEDNGAANQRTENKNLDKPIVVSFTLDRTVKALGFEMERQGAPGPGNQQAPQPRATSPAPAPTPAPAPAPAPAPEPEQPGREQPEQKGLRLDDPRPGEQVRAPLQVSGTTVGVNTGTVRVRLKNSNGVTLAERPVQVNGGQFNTTINFSPPVGEESGFLEAFVTGNGGIEKDMVTVPVKIVPGRATETIGAP